MEWQKSFDLTAAIYSTTKGFPSDEKYDLTSQIRRAAVSVPSNTAEGAGRASNRDLSASWRQYRVSF